MNKESFGKDAKTQSGYEIPPIIIDEWASKANTSRNNGTEDQSLFSAKIIRHESKNKATNDHSKHVTHVDEIFLWHCWLEYQINATNFGNVRVQSMNSFKITSKAQFSLGQGGMS